MLGRRRVATAACLAALGGLAGAGDALADPTDATPTPTPVIVEPAPPPPPVSNNPMTPRQPPVPASPAPAPAPGDPAAPGPAPAAPAPGDPAAPPPAPGDPAAPPPPRQTVPNTVPPPGNSSGGGILGSIKDLWHQAQNPFMNPGDLGGSASTAPPPGAGPAPQLPPGYVSINAPRSEIPAGSTGIPAVSGPYGGSVGRPELPPGYYPVEGPPPPWYLDPTQAPQTAPPAS